MRALAVWFVVLLAGPPVALHAQGADLAPAIAFRPAVERAIEGFIIPAYRALADAATTEAGLADALCDAPAPAKLQAARTGFRDLVLAWSRVELFRFGPAREDNRYERLFFWPDPRGIALRQIQGIIGGEDESATTVASLRGKSVAVQGLPALEFVLFGAGSDDLAAGPPDSFRCRYAHAVAGAIALTAEELLAGWEGPDGYAALMREAGSDNPVYRSHGEVVQELLKSAREQLQLVRDVKIGVAIGKEAGAGAPRLAPFWRSGLTPANIIANVRAVADLAGPDGLGAVLPEGAEWQAESLVFELGEVSRTISEVEDASDGWEVQVSEGFERMNYTLIPLATAIALLQTDYPGALGLISGFNSLDGD